MQKKSTKYYHAKLVTELSSLRKGRGLSPAKMTRCATLREVAARAARADDNGITNSQIHNLLLAEIAKLPHNTPLTALRFAFSLAEEARNLDTLQQRRQALAHLLGKHPDTIIRYENQAINDLALHLEELDAATRQKSPVQAGTPVNPNHQHMGIMRDTATLNLSGLLPVANRASELVGYLEQSQRPFLEATVVLKLVSCSRGDDWYRFEMRYTFTGVRSTFRLAVVTDREDGEQLLTRGLIDEFHNINLNDSVDPAQEMRVIMNSARFIAHNHESKSQKLFRLHELDSPQADRLLRSAGGPLKSQCRFLEISIPSEWQNGDITYEYRSAFNLRDDIHYAFWYAPSMMFVKKLVFDYSDFPGVDTWDFIVMPFLGNLVGESTRNLHSFTAHPNNWIMPGHGIALVWEAKGAKS